MRSRVLAVASAALTGIAGIGLATAPAATAATSAPTLSASSYSVVAGTSGPLGDVTLTESAPGQLQVGDVLTYRFSDGGVAALHFSTAGTVGGTNGLAGKATVVSSSGTAADEMQVQITSASSGSFPGVLTLSGLTAAVDATAAAGADTVTVTDSNAAGTPSPATVSDATILSSGTSRAQYAAQSAPSVLSTGSNQAVGSVTLTEPAKDYFKTGDVITFSLRDTNGSGDTIGLAAQPVASGGSMTVSVAGASGSSVQVNDTSFRVVVNAQDPSNGSTSTLTVSNLVVNSAKAPIGPVTLSAAITTGNAAGEPIVPGRVVVANVGGNTNTTASGAPALDEPGTAEVAGNVVISVAAGSLNHADSFSLQSQTPGVTFDTTTPPLATVTSGNLTLGSASPTLDAAADTATWKVANGNSTASTIVVGPIEYDVAANVSAGTQVQLLASGDTGSAFTPQVVSDAVVAPTVTAGSFRAVTPLPSEQSAPWTGADVTYTETAAGSTPAGSAIVLVSPYATQISAYRTTFDAVPTATATNGLTLGTPTVNSSAVVVPTPTGSITAPAQTVVTIPVTAASSGGPATVRVSGLVYRVGDLVQPGAFVLTGLVQQNNANVGGNQLADLVNTRNIGTTSATTPPVVTFTETPPASTNLDYGTFAFSSDQDGTTFFCSLDGHMISLNCSSPHGVAGLAEGSHTFVVQGFNAAGYQSNPVSYTWTVDTTAPTITSVVTPKTLTAPLTVTFDEPVLQVNPSAVVLTQVAADSTVTPVAATLACGDGSTAPAACDPSAAYTVVVVRPSAPLVPGEHYVLTVNPNGATPLVADAAGNPVALSTTAFRGAQTIDDRDPANVVGWRTVRTTSASGGSYAVDGVKGAAVTFGFTGTSVSWVTATGPNQGEAAVYVDGTLVQTVNDYASSTHWKVQRTFGNLAAGAHTLRIVVLGKAGSTAATGALVTVDGFVAGTTATDQTGAGVRFAWAPTSASSAYQHGYAQDNGAGASWSLTFRGTSVTWWTVYGPAMGKAQIVVDGVTRSTVSNYASATAYGKAHAVTGLADGVHTLRIVVLGQKVSASKGTYVAVDRLTVG